METEESTPEQRRRNWLDRITAEFEKIEPFAMDWDVPDNEAPAWVANVEKKFAEDTFPLAKLKTSKALTPRLLGSILGQQCAYAVWLMDWVDVQIAAQTDTTETEDEAKTQEFADSFTKWYSGLRKLAKKALCSSVDQTYEDMSAFLTAYAAGFAKKPTGTAAGNLGSTTFEIYLFLILFWRQVQGMNSVAELHLVLQKVLGRRAGDLKRVEQICQRNGLHLRERGRPKKPK